MNNLESNEKKQWHKPFLRTMSRREVENAIVLTACSGYCSGFSGCSNRNTRSF